MASGHCTGQHRERTFPSSLTFLLAHAELELVFCILRGISFYFLSFMQLPLLPPKAPSFCLPSKRKHVSARMSFKVDEASLK